MLLKDAPEGWEKKFVLGVERMVIESLRSIFPSGYVIELSAIRRAAKDLDAFGDGLSAVRRCISCLDSLTYGNRRDLLLGGLKLLYRCVGREDLAGTVRDT